ncbi:hypothetical protein SmJEL517_g02716 [Synchytrium microbalum]|uniref:Methyltransferase FkbM domain-containing protein n=1 Tax=Synchytrium microbalum TaxID=1806994 RepID=A0A507C5H9_9FUNG|nr:uncharacterized protein SmJEL517_g02716 [Synchytrium microbalum]TPX34741.1 hypothetical protein SmJEL517_g02716 [Synchytrium microbalum]
MRAERTFWIVAGSFLAVLCIWLLFPGAPMQNGTGSQNVLTRHVEESVISKPHRVEEPVIPKPHVQQHVVHRASRSLLSMTAMELMEDADTTQLTTCQWSNSVEYIDYQQVTITSMPGNPFEMVVKAGKDDIVSYSIISTNQWEGREVRSVIDRLALVAKKRGTNVTLLDIGANIGFFSLSAAASGYNVVSVEMMGQNQASLLKSICKNPSFHPLMRVIPYGLGERGVDGSRSVCLAYSLMTNSRNGIVKCGNNVNASDIPEGFSLMGTTLIMEFDEIVPVVPELRNVGVVKLDTEGFEAHVMKGAYNFFKDVKPPFLKSETSNFMLIRAGSKPRDLLDLLDELDYEIHDKFWDGPIVAKNAINATFDGFDQYLLSLGDEGLGEIYMIHRTWLAA